MTDTVAVACDALTVRYGITVALRGATLDVGTDETVALLGPSGAGKTTLLHAVAGFIEPDAGEIRIGGTLVSGKGTFVPPERRAVGMVFQQFALWPHLDALATVAYPLQRAGATRDEAHRGARELLARLGMDGLEGRRPAELSGGEQQRVGLARALARRPAVFLLDEPTAHLDGAARAEFEAELARRRREQPVATIHATHDVDEALGLADRVALMRDGAVVQVGTPRDVYERPIDRWAAALTGPAAFLSGRLETDVDGRMQLVAGEERAPIEVAQSAATRHGGAFLVRPDWACLGGSLRGSVRTVRFRGTHTDYELESAFGALTVREPGPPRAKAGESVAWSLSRAWAVGGSPRDRG